MVRVSKLWSGISKSRHDFEAEPDTSIIGKTISRFFNIVWNYLFKGLLGTSIILCFFTATTTINIGFSLFFFVTFLFWAIFFSFTAYLWRLLIKEHELFAQIRKHSQIFPLIILLWRLSVQGIVYLLFQLLILGSCPIIFVLLSFLSVIRFLLQTVYDFILFWLILVPKGRIPASDSFLVRRVKGPGLSSIIYSRAPIELVIIRVQVLFANS